MTDPMLSRLQRPREAQPMVNERVPHTAYSYNHGCRCEPCVDAHRTYMREYMQRQRDRRRKDPIKPEDRRHGKASTYRSQMCRCESCRAAVHDDYVTRRDRGASA